jgi:2-isopropylmalate synthase
VAVRTLEADLIPVAEIQQKTGMPLEVGAFLGSSPIRMDVEDWDLEFLLVTVRKAMAFCRRHHIPAMMVTEDTTRAKPEVLRAIYRTALDEGAQAICLSDTCGHATPAGARNLVKFMRDDVLEGKPVRIDWHGHNDRGLGVANAIAAFEAGADRLHGSILGIGERCGNVALDQLMMNLILMGYWKGDLTDLPALADRVAELCGFEIPANYPVLGRDAFRTGTGVHAAAIVKALRRGDADLADAVYSGVPASLVNRRQEIEIGPVAGHSNVTYWLELNGFDSSPDRIERVLRLAKQSARILTDDEIRAAL